MVTWDKPLPPEYGQKIEMINRTFAALAAFALAACALAAPARITAAKAAKIAQAKYHGKLMGTPKLEHEDGVWQYEVLLRIGKTMKEVNVTAASGKIASVENTTPKEEAREAKADKKKGKVKGKDEKGEKEEKNEMGG